MPTKDMIKVWCEAESRPTEICPSCGGVMRKTPDDLYECEDCGDACDYGYFYDCDGNHLDINGGCDR